MRLSDANLMADQLSINIRWLVLLSLTLLVAWAGALAAGLLFPLVILGLAMLWNVALYVYFLAGQRFPLPVYAITIIDGLLALGLFLAGNMTGLSLGWAGLLPVLSAAFYYGLEGGLIAAGAMTLGMGVVQVLFNPAPGVVATAVGIPALSFFAVAAGGGYGAQQLGRQLREQIGTSLQKQRKAKQLDRERLEAIYAVTATMTSTLNLDRLLELALDVSTRVLADEHDTQAGMVSVFLLATGGRLVVGTGRRMNTGDQRAVLPGNEGAVVEALEKGDPRVIDNPVDDPELRRVTAFHQCKQAYVYPLRTARELFGALVFGHPHEDFFNGVNLDVLEIVGRQCLVALRNAELYQDLEREQRRMLDVQEEAQKKLARDLHDGPTQSVAAIAMRVNFTRRLMERDPKSAAEELFKIEDLARRTTKEIRHMLFTLRPLVLESSGLFAALESMADKMRETYGQNVVVECDAEIVELLEMGKQAIVFYIAEEAVNNARKHAEAQTIWVRLRPSQREDVAMLEIEDDGVGFDVGAVDAGYENRGSLGMVNMRERAHMLNGLLKLESKVGQGTRIRVWIPLDEDAAMALRSQV